MNTDSHSPLPPLLVDLRVAEWGQGMAVAYAAKMFADLGARVVRLDDGALPQPHRAAGTAVLAYLDGRKETVPVDLSTPAGRQEFHAVLATADLLLEDHTPADNAALGTDYASLAARHPRLIVTSITPFGQTGPYRNYRGGDLVAAFMSGLAHLTPRDISPSETGEPQPPLKMPGSLVSVYAGVSAAGASLAALRGRQQTGRGQQVDIAMVETLIPTIRRELVLHRYEKQVATRFMRVWRLAPWGVKRCKDGHVFLQVVEEHHWRGLVEMMGNPEWARDPRYLENMYRYEHRHEIEANMQPWLLTVTRAEVAWEAQRRSVPFAPVNTLVDMTGIPQLHYRRFFQPFARPGSRPCLLPGAPYRFIGYQNAAAAAERSLEGRRG